MSLIIVFSFRGHHRPTPCSVDNIPRAVGNEIRLESGWPWDSTVKKKTLKGLSQNLCCCLSENQFSHVGPNPSPHMPDWPFTHPSDIIVQLPEHSCPTVLGHHRKGNGCSAGHHFGSLSLPSFYWGRFWTIMVLKIFKPKFYRLTRALSWLSTCQLQSLALVSLLWVPQLLFPWSWDHAKKGTENKLTHYVEKKEIFLWLLVCKNKIKDNTGSHDVMDNDNKLDDSQEKANFIAFLQTSQKQ